MKKPYIYTMPESFMKDQSVPARWRLLGIINGFHISGNDFYASNEWIMNELGCSEQTVSNAVQELEDLKEIECARTRRSRLIKRRMRDPNQLGSETLTDSLRDPNQLGTNSDSNSDRELSANAEKVFTIETVDQNGDTVQRRAKSGANREVLAVFELFKESNPAWVMWRGIPTQREAAKNLLSKIGYEGTVKLLEYTKSIQSEERAPTVYSPYDLFTKIAKIKSFRLKQKNG